MLPSIVNVSPKYKTPETEYEAIERARKKQINRSKARQVTWFNPPFSKQVESSKSVGRAFFAALDQCFPSDHPLYKILNHNTTKMSYRTMPNLAMMIKGSNGRILKEYIKLNKSWFWMLDFQLRKRVSFWAVHGNIDK